MDIDNMQNTPFYLGGISSAVKGMFRLPCTYADD